MQHLDLPPMPFEWLVEVLSLDELLDLADEAIRLRTWTRKNRISIEDLAHALHRCKVDHDTTLLEMAFTCLDSPNMQARVWALGVLQRHPYDASQLEAFQQWLKNWLVLLHQLKGKPSEHELARMRGIRLLNTVNDVAVVIRDNRTAFDSAMSAT